MDPEHDAIAPLLGSTVVLDTATPYVYIGVLKAWNAVLVTLADADVHDVSAGGSGKDMYIHEARRHGVQQNRREAHVRTAMVVSVSRLDDVLTY